MPGIAKVDGKERRPRRCATQGVRGPARRRLPGLAASRSIGWSIACLARSAVGYRPFWSSAAFEHGAMRAPVMYDDESGGDEGYVQFAGGGVECIWRLDVAAGICGGCWAYLLPGARCLAVGLADLSRNAGSRLSLESRVGVRHRRRDRNAWIDAYWLGALPCASFTLSG
jgi:hypothetical protein